MLLKKGYKLFTFDGIDFEYDLSFIAFLVLFFLITIATGGVVAGLISGTVLMVIMLSGLLLHEYGHAKVAKHFGIEVPIIRLFFFGGAALLKSTFPKPKQEALIAIAGPAVSLLLAGVSFLVFLACGGSVYLFRDLFVGNVKAVMTYPVGMLVLAQVIAFNFVVALFNLLPAFPMDGGRVLRAALATLFGFIRGTKIASYISYACCVLMAVGFVYMRMYSLVLLTVFIAFFGYKETKMTIREWNTNADSKL